MDTGGRWRVALVLATVITVNASYTVLIPFVPELQHRIAAGPVVIALVFALFAGGKALAQPLGGFWVDRWQARHVAFGSLFVVVAGILTTAYARDPVVLLAGRACWGVGEGLLTPALYAGATLLCRRYALSTSRMMGSFGSAAVAGFLLGPLIAGLATPLGLEALFVCGAVATLVAAFGLQIALKPRAPATGRPPAPVDPATSTVSEPATQPAPDAAGGRWWVGVLGLGALDLTTNLAYAALEPTLPLYLTAGLGPESARTGISAVFVVGLTAFGVFSWLLGWRAEHLSILTLARGGLTFLALGLAGLSLTPQVVPVAGWFVVIMCGQAMLYLAARRGVIQLSSARNAHGKAFGLFGATSDVGHVLGPVVGMALYQSTGRLSFILLGVFSSFLLLVVLSFFYRVGEQASVTEHASALTAAPERARE